MVHLFSPCGRYGLFACLKEPCSQVQLIPWTWMNGQIGCTMSFISGNIEKEPSKLTTRCIIIFPRVLKAQDNDGHEDGWKWIRPNSNDWHQELIWNTMAYMKLNWFAINTVHNHIFFNRKQLGHSPITCMFGIGTRNDLAFMHYKSTMKRSGMWSIPTQTSLSGVVYLCKTFSSFCSFFQVTNIFRCAWLTNSYITFGRR